jgi:acyl carrier protein
MEETALNENDFLLLVTSIVESGGRELEMSDALEDLGWDSLTNLSFIAKIDERLGTSVDADLLSNAVTIRDLFQFVSN